MKLYFAPGACSLSPHIVLREGGVAYEAIQVDVISHTLPDGADYYAINAKGAVPVLELPNGERLTEGVAIVQYLADLVSDKNLAPANGTWERCRLQEMLNFIATELHKGFSLLANPAMPQEAKALGVVKLKSNLKWIDTQLTEKQYLLGDQFTVADAYLFTVSNWAQYFNLDLSEFTNLLAFRTRVASRPAVQEAMKAEGLLK
ncbi:glutathione transferase GstA [Polaromonas sp.]|uniref:glutathione transferase GstA n=1 Tax=Polaromonas sp. TaxID=1869339 RepID=UPI003263AB97